MYSLAPIVDREEHVRVQDRFERMHCRGFIWIGDGFVDPTPVGGVEGLAKVGHGLFELAHLLCQRLQRYRSSGRRVLLCGVLRGCDAAQNSSHPEFHDDSDLG
jgi:hypothetical protein